MNLLRNLFRMNSTKAPVAPLALPNASFHVTLWPTFDHFRRFAMDDRIQGIRLNSAMISASEIDEDFLLKSRAAQVPLWFDVKGMQMRIKQVHGYTDHLEFTLNRPVEVKTPCTVYFKAGEDGAKCLAIKDGTRFVFAKGPRYTVRPGESVHILEPDLKVGGPTFLDYEIEKIDKIKKLGFKRWYLSYVYAQQHVDDCRALIGDDAELILKIENQAGLDFVAKDYKPARNTRLMAARGDLYVEVGRPHQMLNACKLVVSKDPSALVGSRMLLSIIKATNCVPSSADFCELAWLYDVGYRNFLLCDELCLKEHWLAAATNAFCEFRQDYCGK
jgi:hypothetical protein